MCSIPSLPSKSKTLMNVKNTMDRSKSNLPYDIQGLNLKGFFCCIGYFIKHVSQLNRSHHFHHLNMSVEFWEGQLTALKTGTFGKGVPLDISSIAMIASWPAGRTCAQKIGEVVSSKSLFYLIS